MATTTASGFQEASDMLAEALKQVDGLLAGTIKRDHSAHTPQNGIVERCSPKLTHSPKQEHSRAVRLLNDLRATLEGTKDQGQIFRQLVPETQKFLKEWLDRCGLHKLSNGYPHSPHSPDTADHKLRRLETEKEDLTLQVSVLSDQIDAQVEKIQDLERSVRLASNGNMLALNGHSSPNGHSNNGHSGNGHSNGNMFSMELLNRSHGNGGGDTHKLDLMAENSNLKLRLSATDREKTDLEMRLNYAQKRMDELQSRLNDQTIEVSELRSRTVKNGTIPSSPDPSDVPRDRTMEREKTLDRLKRKHTEVEKLKKAVEALMITNSEKDSHIAELKRQMKRFHQIEELITGSQGRHGNEFDGEDHSDGSSTHNSHTSGGHDAGKENIERYGMTDHKPQRTNSYGRADIRNVLMQPTATSTPVNVFDFGTPKKQDKLTNGSQTPPSTISKTTHTPSPKRPTNSGIGRSNSCEDMKPPQRSPPGSRKGAPGTYGGTLPKDTRLLPSQVQPNVTSGAPCQAQDNTDQADDQGVHSPRPRASTLPKGKPPRGPGTLTPKGSFRSAANRACRTYNPSDSSASSQLRQQSSTLSQRGSAPSQESAAQEQPNTSRPQRKQKGFRSFGKGIFKGKSGKWSSSAPNLAQTETDEEALKDEMAQRYKELQQQGTEQRQRKHKSKGGIKRFFGKLRRSNSQDLDPDKVGDFKRSGLRATAGPRLGWSRDMKYTDVEVPFPRWDKDRIATWLHGLGLSMYVGDCKRWIKNGDQLLKASSQEIEKELGVRNYFHRKKLQLALQAVNEEKKSAMDDLDHNWVTRWMDDIGLPQYKDQFSEARIDGRMLHYMTIEDLVALKVTNVLHHLSVKRAIQVLRLSDFNAGCLKRRPVPDEPDPTNSPGEVMLWTNHRVMEWLRCIDLSEYAPNLRGSGVHGGLMVLEPRFGSEIFASLLSIPASKTLLRRHLSTHFVGVIGNDIQHKKRDIEIQPGFIPLTPGQKVKLKKRLFGHKRTRSIDAPDDDLVCPMGSARQNQSLTNGQSNGSPSWTRGATLPKVQNQESSPGCLG